MSFKQKQSCVKGCGDFGRKELDNMCDDCYQDHLEQTAKEAQWSYEEERKEFLLKYGKAKDTNEISSCNNPNPKETKASKFKVMQEFYSRSREVQLKDVKKELADFNSTQSQTKLKVSQIRKYMISSNMEEDVDRNTWIKYFYARNIEDIENEKESIIDQDKKGNNT